jgi:DNA-binding transcriptional ArsR family regulator
MALTILNDANVVKNEKGGAAMATAGLLLHPVRLRIVQAFLGDRSLTTAELHEELPDVPPATLYRHVATLAGAGVLAVAEERRVRGAAERRYRLVTEAVVVGPDEAATLGPDEHRRAFTSFVAALLADFDRYVGRAAEAGPLDLAADRVGYRQVAVWVTDEEFDDLLGEINTAVEARLGNPPGGVRRRRVISRVTFPSG